MRITLTRQNNSAIKTLAKALIVCFAFLGASNVIAQQSAVQPPPTVVFMTDFGVVDDSVALCKGVMYGIAPNLRIVDLTHQVNAFSIRDGAMFLFGASPYFPAGTVFVAVVDPEECVGLHMHVLKGDSLAITEQIEGKTRAR